MHLSRRNFITVAGAGAATVLFSSILKHNLASAKGYGELVRDPKGIFDLPKGFQYKILSRQGERMTDGTLVPTNADGMGAFVGANRTTILIRNHELSPGEIPAVMTSDEKKFDKLSAGGTTTLIVDSDRNLIKHYVSLAGTNRNCAGGTTPWGSWISCEEDVSPNHGYNFEIPSQKGIINPEPLVQMGRFRHEAIAVDPNTGYIYQTEDQNDSCFYRFCPHQKGNLKAGGILEALVIEGMRSIDTGIDFALLKPMKVKWVVIEEVDPKEDTLRNEAQSKGAAIFRRGEGICFAQEMIYWICTNGGKSQAGQIFRYHPAKETVELFVESPGKTVLDYPDNIIMSPYGHLILCEDGRGEQFLVGVTPEGKLYHLGRNALNNSELAGVCFSPDGQTMFVNIYSPGMTLAIWGNW